MNAARISSSERLQRTDALLASGLEYSTLDIIQQAHVCAVNSIISELRANGRNIKCQRKNGLFYYQVIP